MTITESCNWEAPVTGWYKFQIKGGGGGGGGAYVSSPIYGGVYNGGGGGEGGTTIAFEYMKKGEIAQITIGKGGKGALKGNQKKGEDGQDSIILINNNKYIAGGGKMGIMANSYTINFGKGGLGTIPGISGGSSMSQNDLAAVAGGAGGGNGGGVPYYLGKPNQAIYGGGGAGGSVGSNAQSYYDGGDGGDGVCWIEYYDPKKK